MNLLIRADASSRIGAGHIMRCLALAQIWLEQNESRVTFLTATISPRIELRLQLEGISTCHMTVDLGSSEDATQTIIKAKETGADWVIVDGYHFDSEYQRMLKVAGLRLLFFDDYGHSEHYYADIVLNQNICAKEETYNSREPYTRLLLGTSYTLLRKEFWPWRKWRRTIPDLARNVLITLGGADPNNVTLKVIRSTKMLDIDDTEVLVVAGGSNASCSELSKAVQDSDNITLKHDVADMSELMAWADVAVSAGGSTCWELAFVGLPSLIVTLAENQRETVETLHSMEAIISLGWHKSLESNDILNALNHLMTKRGLRDRISACSQSIVDGIGAERVMHELKR